MAKIDFSNAYIECVNPSCYSKATPNFGLNGFLTYESDGKMVNSLGGEGNANNIVNITSNGYSIIKNGTVDRNGNVLYIRFITREGTYAATVYNTAWKISNIEYAAGDTFSFQINVSF